MSMPGDRIVLLRSPKREWNSRSGGAFERALALTALWATRPANLVGGSALSIRGGSEVRVLRTPAVASTETGLGCSRGS